MDYQELDKRKPLDEQAEFVMSFVDDSEKRNDMRGIWDEVDDNYLVRPAADSVSTGTNFPLDFTLGQSVGGRGRPTSVLKDPETHQEIMTLLARMTLDLFPRGSSFVSARAIGFEDIGLSRAVNKLTEHAFRLPGQYWNRILQLLYALLRGTGVGRWTWEFEEEFRNRREISVNPFVGDLEFEVSTQLKTTWNDPKFKAIDSRNFYPDQGMELLHEMKGAAEHYRMSASSALRQADRQIFNKAAVRRAIDRRHHDMISRSDKRTDSPADISPDIYGHPDYMELDTFEFYGETPFKGESRDPNKEDGIFRRVITVMNGETVRSKPWPRLIPYSEIKVIPRPGSFWGLSVGELVRFDQDFADTIKMMLSDAVVLMTHPPFIYDKNSNVDLRKLRRFSPKVPIGADRPDAVQTLRYEPRLADAFTMYGGVKGQMRDASSALDALQGQTGPDRESATVGTLRHTAAQSRPELFSTICEQEWLPQDGRIVTELYQEFLENDFELIRRIGESTPPVSILGINDVEFNVEFIGSREQNRIQKVENFREINAAAASNPIAAQIVPWVMLYRKWFKDLGAEDIAEMVGNPELIQLHTVLSMLAGRNASNNNGAAQSTTAPQIPQAQTAGILTG